MEKLLNSYETLFVVNPQLSEEDTKSVIAKFVSLIEKEGTVTEVKEWGKRRLAYPINDLNEGYYVLATFKSAATVPAELERRFKINDNIMRAIVVRKEEAKAEADETASAE